MAKPKTPSPQEQYRARKAREEKERLALLPPGLLNHGNTCFMNSVLQGLIATQYLQLFVHFRPLPVAIQRSSLTSHRSPVLTNGHGLAREFDQPWIDALPIGDHLVAALRTAWDIQNNRKRENMSPKDILAELGKKYDQYLDFRQQDAHEFLCQLLDAIRMEEIDVIKQRSPPQKNASKRARPSRSQDPSASQPPLPADHDLFSFVDMLFGGKLTSILVCQTCKHVSHTYEDFTDLSLSMKPEDYVRERRRDKLKQFAKKIGTAFSGVPQQRSSSVPATPIRSSNLDSPEPDNSQRRRSIDLADVDMVIEPIKPTANVAKEDTAIQVPPSPSLVTDSPFPETPTDTPQPVPAPDHSAPAPPQESCRDQIISEKLNGKEKRDKDESWAKLGRRITVSVGLAKRPKSERKDKKVTPAATPLKPAEDGSPLHHSSAPLAADTPSETASQQPHPERVSTSLGLVNEKLQVHLTNVKRSVVPMPSQRSGNSPSGSSVPRFPLISRPSSPHPKTARPPRPPKLSVEEAAYLRDILADINPPNIQKPFSIFKQSKELPSISAQNIFLKVNQINRIEECLRLFTSVEVLDGDNTVRCHRCWKIANGFYKPRARESAQEPDSCTDSEDEEALAAKPSGNRPTRESISSHHAIATASHSNAASASQSTTSLHDTQTSRDTQATLTQPLTRSSPTCKQIPPALQLNDQYPIELVSPINNEPPTPRVLGVPPRSTTNLESPQTAKPPLIRGNTVLTQASASAAEHSSGTSHSAPSYHHRQHGSDSNTESEISEAESETLLTVYSDLSSAASTSPSPNDSQEHLQQPLPTLDARRTKENQHPSGVPRSRQFLSRPAYKRYLIATPPPILIIHLKRFQQLSKMPVVSFSTGFKKLDDYISFPEYLDLAPYLAPRREDYFDSKVAMTRGRSRRAAPCMYRLYAVVVHIGNMLGGHYVAYTALPPSPPSDVEAGRSEGEKQRSDGTISRDWAFISDTIVRLASLEEVLKSKAYICMYERI